MSISVPPPEYQFTGLIFNPDFWVSSSSSLTQDVANTLYLRKTVTDTASALETFNGGIRVNDIAPTASTTNLVIAPSLTSGQLFLGVNATATGGRTAHIHIGDANNLPAGAGIHINNGTTNASNTNISNGANTSGNVNILTGATSTGTLTLGGSSTVTRLGVPLTPLYTTLPTIAQIGHVFAMTGATFGAMGGSPATKTYTMNLGTNTTGVWAIFGTASLQCDANGTITSYKLYINNGTTLAVQQITDKAMTTSNNIFTSNVSSVGQGPSNSITLKQELTFSSGSYSSASTDFMFRIVRIA